MTDDHSRTAPARDVPAPRPVTASATSSDESGLGRAARSLADAVTGLLGNARDADGGDQVRGAGRAAAAGLRDVVGAVASAVGAARSGRGDTDPAAPQAPAAPRGDRAPGAVLGDLLAAAAPRLPIRDGSALRRAYPGATDAEIADALVARAARVTTGIGAATGGLSAAQWFTPPTLLALPLELGAETVLTGAVEVVLVGELHELYGRPAEGDARTRAGAYLASWSAQRSVDAAGAAGLGSLLGGAGLKALRRRMTRRLAGAIPSAAPFLIGAALAGRGNRKATETLADRVLTDLRRPPQVGAGN
ncbi:MAG: hypothetical protein QOJ68_958 [Blastococcus sp.]|jgi:hypothetical protein|nr:hypothetical protein [Blastococcus sp.]